MKFYSYCGICGAANGHTEWCIHGGGTGMRPEEPGPTYVPLEAVCECGSGDRQPSAAHSHWCPIYSPLK